MANRLINPISLFLSGAEGKGRLRREAFWISEPTCSIEPGCRTQHRLTPSNAGGFVLSLLLTFAGVGTGGEHEATRATGVVMAFAVGTALLYGAAFLAILGYRLNPDELHVRPVAAESSPR